MSRNVHVPFAIALLTALFVAGCAFEPSTDEPEASQSAVNDVELMRAGSLQAGKGPQGPNAVQRQGVAAFDRAGCTSCGPLPDPWTMSPSANPVQPRGGGGGGGLGSSSGDPGNGSTKPGKR